MEVGDVAAEGQAINSPCGLCGGRGWKLIHDDGIGLHLVAGGRGNCSPQDCLACDGSGISEAA